MPPTPLIPPAPPTPPPPLAPLAPLKPLNHKEKQDRLLHRGTGLAEMDWLHTKNVKLQAGDVFIKHVFHAKGATENLIKLSANFHVFDKRGSVTAEHAGLVGSVDNETRMMEAVSQGIVLQGVGGWASCTFPNPNPNPGHEDGMSNLHKNNAYVVYRLTKGSEKDKRVLHMLWQGMATRLATIQGENPPPVCLDDCFNTDRATISQLYDQLYEAASTAHMPKTTASTALSLEKRLAGPQVLKGSSDGRQATKYSIPVMVGHALPTLIPDNWVGDSNDLKYISFIAGERTRIKDICSGFAATMLQAWSIICGHGRVFTDPVSIHPTGLEHHLKSGHLRGWTCVGIWGRGECAGGH